MDNATASVTKSKIVFLGDQSVGKTSIINRFIFDNFTGSQQPTVGVDFVSKTLTIENKTLRLQLWDTAGQQRFHSLIPSYIKDSQAAIIVFDITSQSSFQNISKWIQNVREVRGDESQIFVLGNKLDLQQQRTVNASEASRKVQQMGLQYNQVSAKNGTNVKEFFRNIAYSLSGFGKKQQKQSQKVVNAPVINPKVNLSVSRYEQQSNKKKSKCC